MAIVTGAHSTYDEAIGTKGNAEDLSNVVHDISPLETPCLTMMGRTKAEATNHEWLVDALEAAAANAHLEGEDSTGTDPDPRSRLGNYTQIMKKVAVVTGTQEAVKKGGGIKSEMAYQVARRIKAMKRDMEYAIVGVSNAKVAGTEAVIREMGSLDSYLVTNNQLAAGSSAVTGNGVNVSDYAGVDRALTEPILKTALETLYTNSGGNENVNMLVTAATKGVISTFTASSTRHVTTDDKKLVSSIDVYEGDFHTVRVIPDRHVKTGLAFIIDPEYLKLAELRKMNAKDLAINGDAIRKQVLWEATLEVCNEKAHCLIGDLTT